MTTDTKVVTHILVFSSLVELADVAFEQIRRQGFIVSSKDERPSEVPYAMDHEGDPSRLVYTFGGVEARASLQQGTILSTSTLD